MDRDQRLSVALAARRTLLRTIAETRRSFSVGQMDNRRPHLGTGRSAHVAPLPGFQVGRPIPKVTAIVARPKPGAVHQDVRFRVAAEELRGVSQGNGDVHRQPNGFRTMPEFESQIVDALNGVVVNDPKGALPLVNLVGDAGRQQQLANFQKRGTFPLLVTGER